MLKSIIKPIVTSRVRPVQRSLTSAKKTGSTHNKPKQVFGMSEVTYKRFKQAERDGTANKEWWFEFSETPEQDDTVWDTFDGGQDTIEAVSNPLQKSAKYLIRLSVFGLHLHMKQIQRNGSKPKVVRSPGARAHSILSFLFSKKTNAEIFTQSIADMREEYYEALSGGRTKHAKWIIVRGNADLGLAAISYLFAYVVKKVLNIWKLVG